MKRSRRLSAAAALLAAGCINGGAERVLSLDAVGGIEVQVLFDVNGSRDADGADRVLGGIGIRVLARESGVQLDRRISDGGGVVRFRDLPVGRYRVLVDSTTVHDSLVVARVDTTDVTLLPGASVQVLVSIGFPHVTIAAARALPPGRKVFTQGLALTARSTFEDSTLHLEDATGFLRAVRVRATSAQPGDSVRLLGTTALRDGQPVLDGVTVILLDNPGLPPAEVVTSLVAAGADAGRLDAALVRVLQVTIQDTATAFGERRLTVDDGSGPLLVTIAPSVLVNTAPLLPDSVMDVSGVLVPSGGAWTLKPRFGADVRRP
jgi:hypothetical protein